jgi:hypothetical protein
MISCFQLYAPDRAIGHAARRAATWCFRKSKLSLFSFLWTISRILPSVILSQNIRRYHYQYFFNYQNQFKIISQCRDMNSNLRGNWTTIPRQISV